MTNKYFTPAPEDIRLGYECECLWCCAQPREWVKITVTQEDNESTKDLPIESVLSRLNTGEIRVPYLTPEQIEADGWEPISMKNIELENRYPFQKGNYFLVLDLRHDVPTIDIILRDVSLALGKFDNPERFRIWMRCKDINTFRKICKLALT